MKTLTDLLNYQRLSYFKSSRFVMPLVWLLLLQLAIYTTPRPIGLMDSIFMSCMYTFLIAMWVGLSYNNLEDEVGEQLLILRVKSETVYYLSISVFLLILSAIISLISAIAPLIAAIVSQQTLFDRPFETNDFFCSLLLLFSCACAGSALGSLLHPRIIKDKKLILLTALFLVVFSSARLAMVREYSFLKFILWVIPPVADITKAYPVSTAFSRPVTFQLFGQLLIYAGAFSAVKIGLLKKIKF
ncbi:hypothetical protein I6N96_01705 [Enterococcus sp. BWM-S5]|uniref:ABC transporter permease n=1 Tax=Enterococcus larvae TaxID=2794352 RepID=A0ABS4CGA0_9ENTE|nr:hypothetical protein [Enterococcus larvae]MBP1044977.1 hypothetical protein [Enterococcus larvae]